MRPALPDHELEHDSWWHEDDVIHQAEGVVAVQLAIPVDHAGAVLRAHAAKVGADQRELAGQVVRHEVFISREDAGLGRPGSPPSG